MSIVTDSERHCDCCDAPALYEHGSMKLCGDCACWQAAVRHGQMVGALDDLGYAVARLRSVEFSEEQIRQALEATLTSSEVEPDYSVSYALLPTEGEGRWMNGVTALSGGGR